MNQLEEFIKEKSIRYSWRINEFAITVNDLREFFKDKVIIGVDDEDKEQLDLMFKILSENKEIKPEFMGNPKIYTTIRGLLHEYPLPEKAEDIILGLQWMAQEYDYVEVECDEDDGCLYQHIYGRVRNQ